MLVYFALVAQVWAAPLLESELRVPLHATGAAEQLQEALTGSTYWTDAWRKTYSGQRYDEIRLKEIPDGYIPMISGEGDADVPRDVVANVVFEGFHDLPSEVGLVRAVTHLGQGHDDTIDADYTDTAFLLDGKLLYMAAAWRIYRRELEDGRHVLWFESLTESQVPVDTWTAYQATRAEMLTKANMRGGLFGGIIRPSELFGLFLVEPGKVHTSRVTFVARIGVGDDAGWIAQWTSQLPPILRAAMRAAFDGAVTLSQRAAAKP